MRLNEKEKSSLIKWAGTLLFNPLCSRGSYKPISKIKVLGMLRVMSYHEMIERFHK